MTPGTLHSNSACLAANPHTHPSVWQLQKGVQLSVTIYQPVLQYCIEPLAVAEEAWVGPLLRRRLPVACTSRRPVYQALCKSHACMHDEDREVCGVYLETTGGS